MGRHKVHVPENLVLKFPFPQNPLHLVVPGLTPNTKRRREGGREGEMEEGRK